MPVELPLAPPRPSDPPAIGREGEGSSVARWVPAPLLRDLLFAVGSTSLFGLALYGLLSFLLTGGGAGAFAGTYLGALVVFLVAVNLPLQYFGLRAFTAARVGASPEGFTIVRAGSTTAAGVQVYPWDALEPGSGRRWTPYLGWKYPIRVAETGPRGGFRVALSREQAELLASFPKGERLWKILG